MLEGSENKPRGALTAKTSCSLHRIQPHLYLGAEYSCSLANGSIRVPSLWTKSLLRIAHV
jgi:hypothetical protein